MRNENVTVQRKKFQVGDPFDIREENIIETEINGENEVIVFYKETE